jgi:hypothetical protein
MLSSSLSAGMAISSFIGLVHLSARRPGGT